jgi:hypothetical protein
MKSSIGMGKGMAVAVLLCGSLLADAPLLAGDGDIIIIRTVQPRSATRLPLTPDPKPLAINPRDLSGKPAQNHTSNIGNTVTRSLGELSDGDFAGISSGQGLGGAGRALNAPSAGAVNHQPNGITNQTLNGNVGQANHRNGGGGAGLAGVPSQVNRSLQQGLRPLQMLTGQ